MTSSDDEMDLSPNTLMDIRARELVENNLPAKSRPQYLKAYTNFLEWKNLKQVDSFSESVLLNYFDDLSKKYKSSTLWSIYSMLKATMITKHQINIKSYTNLTLLLKRLSHGYKAKKSKVFTTQQIQDFLNDAPNEKYLATKVALIFGISGACRGMELVNITVQDVETDTTLQAINLPLTKTNKERMFVISGEYLKIVKLYQELRPAGVTTNRFFLNYQDGRCTKQVIGKNKLSDMPKQIATYLNLPNPEQYTGHCFRRTSATLLADSGANLTTLKRHGGWKSDQVAEGYIEQSIQNKTDIHHNITGRIQLKANKTPQPSTSREPQPSTSWQVISSLAQEQQNLSPQQLSPTFTPESTQNSINLPGIPLSPPQLTKNTINLPGKNIALHIKNCTNCTFNIS